MVHELCEMEARLKPNSPIVSKASCVPRVGFAYKQILSTYKPVLSNYRRCRFISGFISA
jgi:hypothetical protein